MIKVGKQYGRSASEQIEYWALLGMKVEKMVSRAELLLLLGETNSIKIIVGRKNGRPAKFDELLAHLRNKYSTDIFDDGNAVFKLLGSGRFKTQKDLANEIGVSVTVISELLLFHTMISEKDQQKMRAEGKVTRSKCRKFISNL